MTAREIFWPPDWIMQDADGAARSYKLGVQWSMSENASLGALATVGRSAGDDSEAALQVRANVRF